MKALAGWIGLASLDCSGPSGTRDEQDPREAVAVTGRLVRDAIPAKLQRTPLE